MRRSSIDFEMEMSDDSILVDTNVFIHALMRDDHSEECRDFLRKLRAGEMRAQIDPLVVHELTYALPRMSPYKTPREISTHILSILELRGVVGASDVLKDAVLRWGTTPGVGFVDAWLAARSTAENLPVATINRSDFERLRVVPLDL